ncbi:MAG: hypothetical protein WAZ14_02920 [Patescibacteria group bacterium]
MDFSAQLTAMFMSALPSIVLGLVFVALAFLAVIYGRRLMRRLQFKDAAKERIWQAWTEVEEHVADGDDTHLRMAIIQADAVLDMALQAKQFPGRSLNDRLNFAINKYRRLKLVRPAHGLRNRLAHEPLLQLKRKEGVAAIASFKHALRELGALP